MVEVFYRCLQIGLSGSIMILAVLLLRPFLRKAPRNISCLLWLLVALRLLVPFHLESPLSLQPKQFRQSTQIAMTPETNSPSAELPFPEVPSNQAPLNDRSPIPPVSHEPEMQPEQVLAAVWISGASAVLLYTAVSYLVLRYRVRDAVKSPDGTRESDRISGAFLLGYLRPQVYIPTGLSIQDRGFILSHELSHRRRGDHWWKLLGMLCLSIHWYNPLVWLSYALLCRDIEVACDEQVIQNMALEQRQSYSMALLNSGKRLSGFLCYPVAFGEISLKQRIHNVLSYRKPGLWISAIALILTVAVAVCFMTTPTAAAPDQSLEIHQTTQPTTTTAATAPEIPSSTETTAPTEPATAPTTAPTEPATTPTTVPAEPATTPVTEPQPTKPAVAPVKPTVPPTEPPTTEPKPTEPPVTTPTTPPVTNPVRPEEIQPTTPPVTQPQSPVIGGSCGANATWEYDEHSGHLTIRGSGPMVTDNKPPWEAYKSKILSVSISNGITSISPYAFYNCTELRSISIPGSVATIEEWAFCGCEKLQTVRLSEGLQIIGTEAFDDSGIKSIVIPKTVILIESGAFSSCDSLTQITFTGAPPKMEVHTFLWTTATAYYPEHTGTWRSALYDYGGNITWELCCTNHSYINGVCERCGSKKGA